MPRRDRPAALPLLRRLTVTLSRCRSTYKRPYRILGDDVVEHEASYVFVGVVEHVVFDRHRSCAHPIDEDDKGAQRRRADREEDGLLVGESEHDGSVTYGCGQQLRAQWLPGTEPGGDLSSTPPRSMHSGGTAR